ncbi:MAG TPA: hypothetical protein PKL15_10585, partial [Saprospiraceae bacterium]|nr:hypothetical protein [Saprospiraceae bacterium]
MSALIVETAQMAAAAAHKCRRHLAALARQQAWFESFYKVFATVGIWKLTFAYFAAAAANLFLGYSMSANVLAESGFFVREAIDANGQTYLDPTPPGWAVVGLTLLFNCLSLITAFYGYRGWSIAMEHWMMEKQHLTGTLAERHIGRLKRRARWKFLGLFILTFGALIAVALQRAQFQTTGPDGADTSGGDAMWLTPALACLACLFEVVTGGFVGVALAWLVRQIKAGYHTRRKDFWRKRCKELDQQVNDYWREMPANEPRPTISADIRASNHRLRYRVSDSDAYCSEISGLTP